MTSTRQQQMALFSDSFWGAKVQGFYAERPATLDYMSLSEFAGLFKGDPDSGIGAELFSISIMLNNTMLPSRIWFDNNKVADATVNRLFGKTAHWIDWTNGILRLRSTDCKFTSTDVVVVERNKLEMPGGAEMSIRGRRRAAVSGEDEDDDDEDEDDEDGEQTTCPGLVAADDDDEEEATVRIETKSRSVATVSHRSEMAPMANIELVPIEGNHSCSRVKTTMAKTTTVRAAGASSVPAAKPFVSLFMPQ